MRAVYESVTELSEVFGRLRSLSAHTVIVDVEPLVAYWDTDQAALDRGIADVVAQMGVVSGLEVLCFSTNSRRRPSEWPPVVGARVLYFSAASKPLSIVPYRPFPRPGVVVGDQVATDGVLARRLGYTYMHYRPSLDGVPLGPRLMYLIGRLLRPAIFRASG